MVGRGQIWWANLQDPVGSEPGFKRPVLVVQADSYNASKIQTVIVIALTSNMRLADAPGNVALTRSVTGLPKDSVANVSQVMTLDKNDLSDAAGTVDRLTLYQIDHGLRLVLSL